MDLSIYTVYHSLGYSITGNLLFGVILGWRSVAHASQVQTGDERRAPRPVQTGDKRRALQSSTDRDERRAPQSSPDRG